jgi:enterochelin esterase family protein
VVSPQVLPDRRIVFRILAPEAQNVRIAGTDIPFLASGSGAAPAATSSSVMTKAENGVWEVTVGPVPPGSYRYNFNMDGVSVIPETRRPASPTPTPGVWFRCPVPSSWIRDRFRTAA